MLDNLIESQNNTHNTRRGSFMLTTSILVFSLFASGILWSLFAKDLGIGGESLELSSMVAPVVPDVEPPKPEPIEPKAKQEQSTKVETNIAVRRENIANVDEPFVPKDISTKPNTGLSRPKNSEFRIGDVESDPKSDSSGVDRGSRDTTTGGPIGVKNQVAKVEDTEEPPPTITKKVEPKVDPKVEKKIDKIVSLGVINGKSISLPKPAYPPAAKAVRAGGDVNVQVTIDEKGNVISANAVSGHALLRQVSEQAARSAKFTVTYLSNQPVKVTGVIVYKFAMQ